MKDKLTKKRIKVDYELIIRLAGLETEFCNYLFTRSSNISIRRKAYAFLRLNKVDIEGLYYLAKEKGFNSYNDVLKEQIRIAKDHSFYEDD